uniref:phage tail fiber protein n=1 Tax=Enterobacter kobei TaxID=208224 RepID=UPI00358DCA94
MLFQTNGAGQFSGFLRSNGEVQSLSPNSYRIAYGDYGCFWRNDGYNLYLMLRKVRISHQTQKNAYVSD